MSIDEFRSFLGVPAGKLNTWINFKNFAIRPAVSEVSDLSDFKVTVDPVKGKGKGKQFSGVRLSWERKALPELCAVERELNASKVGRKARLAGKVEAMEFGLPPAPPAAVPATLMLRPDTFDKVEVSSRFVIFCTVTWTERERLCLRRLVDDFEGTEAVAGDVWLGPEVIARQADVVPAEWRDVLEETVWNGGAG